MGIIGNTEKMTLKN